MPSKTAKTAPTQDASTQAKPKLKSSVNKAQSTSASSTATAAEGARDHAVKLTHRERLLAACARCLLSKPFSEITLADLAAEAKVSRRTFYECFESKEACLLELCAQMSGQIMQAMVQFVGSELAWPEFVGAVTRTYVNLIREQPVLMQALNIELGALGHGGLELRQRMSQAFAGFLSAQAQQAVERGEAAWPIDAGTALVMVAGVNELILQALMLGDAATWTEVQATAEGVILAVSGVPKTLGQTD